jgi:Short C-terminal domain
MAGQADDRQRSALTDGERHRRALADNRERVLRALDDEKDDEPDDEVAEADPAQPATRTITYRGQTVEVPIGPAGPAAAPHQPMMYRGVPIDAEGSGGGRAPEKASGRRWGRKAKRDAAEDTPEEKLRRLKALLDDGILTEEEFAEKKRELIELL